MQKGLFSKSALIIAAVISVAAICLSILFAPETANAANSGALPAFQNAVKALQSIVTLLLLPVAIILVAWKMVYIAVFGGILGMDPMNLITDTDKDGEIGLADVKVSLLNHASGFVKGLCWVGGLFIIFQVVLSLASAFSEVFAQNFG